MMDQELWHLKWSLPQALFEGQRRVAAWLASLGCPQNTSTFILM
jgi:hypothetical protein